MILLPPSPQAKLGKMSVKAGALAFNIGVLYTLPTRIQSFPSTGFINSVFYFVCRFFLRTTMKFLIFLAEKHLIYEITSTSAMHK
jgi:hypothetical protein